MKEKLYLNKPVLSGKVIEARYIDQLLVDYSGNPFIEGLPPILSPTEAKAALRFQPYFDIEERNLPSHIRLHCVERVKDLIEPLSDHIDMEQRFSRMIRHGYTSISRNPIAPEYVKMLNAGAEAIANRDLRYFAEFAQERSTASGFVIIGMSGIGKTTCVEKILLQYPQVILHSNYKGMKLFSKQIVWLKLDCPFDGGVKGLCLKFFHAIDQLLNSSYISSFAHGSTESMIPRMAQVALLHGLGVLVIDEIQNLNQARTGGSQKMLNFFVELVNCIGIPIVLVGTRQAIGPFSKMFCNGRRCTGEGDKNWFPISNDNEWLKLVNAIFKYQWTKVECPVTPSMSNVLYEESCGITDIAIKLYILAQWRAITTGKEKIDANIIKSVAKDSLHLVKPAIELMKRGETEKLIAEYPDVLISQSQMQYLKNIYLSKQKSPSRNQKKTSKELIDKEEKISSISSWLIQAGFDSDKSIEASVAAFKKLGDNANTSLIRKEAFNILSNESVISENPIIEPSTNSTSELVNALSESKESGKKITDILQDRNIIKDPNELITN